MFTKDTTDRRQALFGGAGEVRVWNLLGRHPAPPFAAVLACELDPGGSVGRHKQSTYNEIVVILEGHGTACVGPTEHTLSPGAVVHLPLGRTLSLANGSPDQPLRYLIIKA